VPGSKNGWLTVKDSVKIARHADAPYPAGIKQAANTNDTPAAADTPADNTAAVEATEGQEG
ncbi:MAG: 50S ribosomal protein L3, partial [Novosphingobium sp.]